MKMRTKLAIVTILALTTCLTRGEDLMKLSMDAVPTNGPKIEVDAKEKVEGKGSLKITTQWPTTVCVGEVTGPDIENAKLIFTAKVKADLDGTALLEMWVQVSKGRYFSRGLMEVVGQKTEWKTIQTSFMFQKGQKPEQVVLNLVINGKGTVWIDDIVLSKEPLK
jgi:hypothetical protein